MEHGYMRTRIKKRVFFVLFVLPILGACGSSAPSLITFASESGAVQYFFPMKEWGEEKGIKAVADITYRYEAGSVAVCNFSFIYTPKAGGKAPPLPTEVSFIGDGVEYSLSGIKSLFSDPGKGQIRITALLGGEDLLAVLRSQSIGLSARFEGTEYRYYPPKDFLRYRDQFLLTIAE
jgi:hypothetical protein